MTDRELLEMAAKAAGMWKADFSLNDDDLPDFYDEKGFRLSWGRGWWNPLSDDGDALRLVVRLEIDVSHFPGFERGSGPFSRADWCFDDQNYGEINEWHHGDPYAATRRAIVRAAAEIGKAMV